MLAEDAGRRIHNPGADDQKDPRPRRAEVRAAETSGPRRATVRRIRARPVSRLRAALRSPEAGSARTMDTAEMLHHEGDGPRGHQDDDDLRVARKESYPGSGGTIDRHRNSEEQVRPLSRLYAAVT